MIGGPFFEIKAIEPALDFTRDMTRYQLYQPKLHKMARGERAGMLRKLLKEWMELVEAMKCAQMQCTSRREWPDSKLLPWEPTALDWMPVVVWLRKQDKSGGWRKR